MPVRRDAEKPHRANQLCNRGALTRLRDMTAPMAFIPNSSMSSVFQKTWRLTVPILALLFVLSPNVASGQIARIEGEREVAAYLRQVWRLKRARTPVRPTPPACTSTVNVSIESAITPDKETLISGKILRVGLPASIAKPSAVEGALVTLDSTTLGVTTDANGLFSLTVPPSIVASHPRAGVLVRRIGYKAVRTSVALRPGSNLRVEVQLCPDLVELSASLATTSVSTAPNTITNNQESGVDEGGIVKRIDDFLVVLRRGRLFTIDTRARTLRAVAAIDAFAPWVNPKDAWFDELIVHGDRVLVVGFDYGIQKTTIGAFRIDERGNLRHEHTYTLSGNDYFSSRNYASRLVDSKLVFYSPTDIPLDSASVVNALPVLREWSARDFAGGTGFVQHTQHIYRPVGAAIATPIDAMHSVTICDLAGREFSCESTILFAPSGSVHYVSPTALYLSTSTWSWSANRSFADSVSALLLRVPLDGQAATAVSVNGVAIDQFSLVERDNTLHMMFRAEGRGARMWAGEQRGGSLGLLSLPVEQLRVGIDPSPSQYRTLPATEPNQRVRNRFVGDVLLYGGFATRSSASTGAEELQVVSLRDRTVRSVRLDHQVERIEVLGDDALIVGQDTADDLHFSGVRLGSRPSRVQHYVVKDGEQLDERSHAFFYRPDENRSRSGVIALPISREDTSGRAFENQVDAVQFLRNTGRSFGLLGELTTQPISPYDDCKASCTDWYGEARPIFLDGRIFALLGYELVEGAIRGNRMVETRRINFMPRTKPPR